MSGTVPLQESNRGKLLSSDVSFSYTHGVKREDVMTRVNSADAKKQLGQILARTARTETPGDGYQLEAKIWQP